MAQRGELVVLVDPAGTPVGTQEKSTVHTTDTPLHLAFSTHVFNRAGQLLVTRRALSKLTWPGVWTNSFCGHPGPGESTENAVLRRADRELGLALPREELTLRLPDFRYRAVDASGIVEHEICPVYTAVTDVDPEPAPDEVMDWQWADPMTLAESVRLTPWAFSPWLVLQLPLLYPQVFAVGGSSLRS
ncbi:isopentenyl-diphosphate Delta-isomerase [Arthrobacter gengyunqii]|uniref:Isopentenyl-diphosphate Delta-isomerase n=1 Tax=Arthrobacter gengyunqii TaxID=2886940 RepID=A0A9X1S4Z1_9MICC|nr:isopentenyl-diphosphate Delta-isomerase [Arthrobacter gengyunqii]MCC3265535.1 isopentenyl-diphosphate Delta-isomerase [Arthrobacter gengyunqii]MCC3268273.1 isopentenyl-diphosphate Delta-isomerase [Arthrobacter gengyunqii]UOY95679.1 isopentenyl-diphosphate Delta-isomerase [Arthrobacter gengyunqii]